MRARLARVSTCLVDGFDPEGGADGGFVGRTTADAPEVDCVVKLPATARLEAGQLVRATIEAVDDYDLIGRVVTGRS